MVLLPWETKKIPSVKDKFDLKWQTRDWSINRDKEGSVVLLFLYQVYLVGTGWNYMVKAISMSTHKLCVLMQNNENYPRLSWQLSPCLELYWSLMNFSVLKAELANDIWVISSIFFPEMGLALHAAESILYFMEWSHGAESWSGVLQCKNKESMTYVQKKGHSRLCICTSVNTVECMYWQTMKALIRLLMHRLIWALTDYIWYNDSFLVTWCIYFCQKIARWLCFSLHLSSLTGFSHHLNYVQCYFQRKFLSERSFKFSTIIVWIDLSKQLLITHFFQPKHMDIFSYFCTKTHVVGTH